MDSAAHGRSRAGTASAFLCGLSVSSNAIYAWLRPGTFRDVPTSIANSSSTIEELPPLLLVGPGTGVAAMRSIIRNRLLAGGVMRTCELNDGAHGSRIGKVHLFFGCRRRDADWLYFDEWREAVEDSRGLLQRDDGILLLDCIS